MGYTENVRALARPGHPPTDIPRNATGSGIIAVSIPQFEVALLVHSSNSKSVVRTRLLQPILPSGLLRKFVETCGIPATPYTGAYIARILGCSSRWYKGAKPPVY